MEPFITSTNKRRKKYSAVGLLAKVGASIASVPFARGGASGGSDGFGIPHSTLLFFLPLGLSLSSEDTLGLLEGFGLSSRARSEGGLLFGF